MKRTFRILLLFGVRVAVLLAGRLAGWLHGPTGRVFLKLGGVFKLGEGFKLGGTVAPGQLGDPEIRGWVLSWVGPNSTRPRKTFGMLMYSAKRGIY